ncbi:methionyl-tRNA formyltransferase [Candidatus Eisenbacteria bacterium]|uniref:Methionyl-tRNA formyltransferase n=1 Tax=Eiseniibacteriota bacterium TaxID=2212470 RepID=A0ABV6YJE3_UNCEI
MKIVFMGTPAFAVPALKRLITGGLKPAVVYTQPPRRSGRGMRLHQPPTATAAADPGLPLRQPKILQRRVEMSFLEDLAPDLIVTVAYGKIFRPRLLSLPRLGCINLHPSLLPRYRGLSPIPWAIVRGEAVTGVTIYRMNEGVDAGPILLQQAVEIRPDDTCGTLSVRLASLGAEMLVQIIRSLADGKAKGMPQREELRSFAPRLERRDGLLDWRLPATQIERIVRAFDPWPGTFCFLRNRRVKVLKVKVLDEAAHNVPPGTILHADGKRPPVVAALPGTIALTMVQCENSRPQSGAAFCCGQRIETGQRLLPVPRPARDPGHA